MAQILLDDIERRAGGDRLGRMRMAQPMGAGLPQASGLPWRLAG